MRNRLTKDDIVTEVSKETGWSRYTVEQIINSTLSKITTAMSHGRSVQFIGFGTFKPKERAARTGRNPHTNEPVSIPARIMPSFEAGKHLKDAVIK